MGETGKEEYKIQSFDAETQQLLKTALKGQQISPSLHHPWANLPCPVWLVDLSWAV